MTKMIYVLPILLATGLAPGAGATTLDNGLSFNGGSLNGESLNGGSLNGLSFNGSSRDGTVIGSAGKATTIILKDGEQVILE